MKGAFFRLNLLEAEVITLFIEVLQTRTIPLLVFLRVLLFEPAYVLGQFFQDFFLKLTFRLARSYLWTILAKLELL